MQVVPDVRSEAFSLPRTYGGVVVSQGMLDTLDEREVAAVLAHEQAHVRQHHHVLVLILHGVTHFVRWVPLIAAIRDAVPHYLEIAADHAASSVAGKRALATALLKLSMPASAQSALLYAAGSDRIRHLVGVQSTPVSIALSVAAVMFVTVLVSVVSAVHWPYIFAIVSGC